jgi:hypothetical protein
MTKVEELRDKEEREMVESELLRMLTDVANREIPAQVAYADIQKRLATAEAQGEAKGAAAIVHCGECSSAKPYPDEPMVECRFGCDRPVDGFCSLGTLLAPDKESK